MKPLLIILTPDAPQGIWPGWHTLWCTPSRDLRVTPDTDDVVVPAREGASAVEQVLQAAVRQPPLAPLAIATGPLPLVLMTAQRLPAQAKAWLTGPDSGTLYVPHSEQFRACAEALLEAAQELPDWLTGGEPPVITLTDVWQYLQHLAQRVSP